jgi:hypothetical protein
MCSYVLNRGEQMVRYYGYYSNVFLGEKQKETEEGAIPHIITGGNHGDGDRTRL